MGHFRPLFLLFSSFQYSWQYRFNKFLPVTGFEPQTSGIGSDRSTNWATTTALSCLKLFSFILTVCAQCCNYKYIWAWDSIKQKVVEALMSLQVKTCGDVSSLVKLILHSEWLKLITWNAITVAYNCLWGQVTKLQELQLQDTLFPEALFHTKQWIRTNR